ncbi:hypothetical protein MKW98_019082 [Papaver atlanticum]|uniref:Uncharacterized protein n=1 Tax=Papaver atlanticum TaxID=357466 RepID=A0AAD4TJR0_9MAGN|nr:hypothetical protein MKW98_019082 [Papaver atlanticum]
MIIYTRDHWEVELKRRIVGIGEGGEHWVGLLHTLATLLESPGSVPINAPLGLKSSPLEDQKLKYGTLLLEL